MAFDATKPNTSQQIGDVITSTRDNDVALKAQIDAHQVDSTAHGLPSLVATQADYVAHKADSTTAHGLATTNAGVLALQTEMGAARGSQSTLATRLASALNADGSIRLSTLNNKWINNADVPTYINATSFRVPGDKISYYIAGAQLRFTISGSYAYAPVASRSFSGGVTTVVIDPAYPVLTGGLSNVDMALIAWDNAVANSCTQNASDIANVQGQVSGLKVVDMGGFFSGTPAANAVIMKYTTDRAITIPAGAANSCIRGTLASAPTTLKIQKHSADMIENIGTVNFGTLHTNLIAYSNDLSNAAWVKTSSTVAASEVFIDAVSPAYVVTQTTTGDVSGVFSLLTLATAGQSFTASAYVKGNGSSVGKTVRLILANGAWQENADKSIVVTLTDKWKRIYVSGTFSGSSPANMYVIIDSTVLLAGESFGLCGVQVESGLVMNSSIVTSGATAARCNGYGAFSVASPVSLAPGESIMIVAPATPDATLANISCNIQGVLS